MIRPATSADRDAVIKILAASFDANPAVNDTIIPDAHRARRLIDLMEYLVDTAFAKRGVYVADDFTGAILMYDPVAYPNRFADILRQLKLVHRCVGWSRLNYTAAKDKKIRSYRPLTPHLYLSMIGTIPESQGKGIGSEMIAFIQELATQESKSIYLETSVPKNVELYKRKGFIVHGDWKIREDYHVHFMQWPEKERGF